MSEKAIYFDSSKCTGCKGCQVACKVWNNLPSSIELNAGVFTGSYQNPPDLDANTRLIVTFDEDKGDRQYGVNWAIGHYGCMHCTDAACVNVCPTGCLYHNDNGFVVYDVERCIGCQYCRSACPFGVPRHTGVGLLSGQIRINKCDGCPDRVEHGMAPACVSTCQPNALEFGDRDELLAKANERVETLKALGFDKARVFGQTEVGGTHLIQVLKYGIEQYPYLPSEPETLLSGLSDFMKPLAAVAGVGVVAGLGLTYARAAGYKRTDEAYDPETHELFDEQSGEVTRTIDVKAGER